MRWRVIFHDEYRERVLLSGEGGNVTLYAVAMGSRVECSVGGYEGMRVHDVSGLEDGEGVLLDGEHEAHGSVRASVGVTRGVWRWHGMQRTRASSGSGVWSEFAEVAA